MRACWQPRSPPLPLGLVPSLTHVTGPHTVWARSLALAARHLQALSPSLHRWPPLLCMCPQLAPAAARVHTNSKGQSCLWVWIGSHSYDWPVVLQGPASSTPICVPAHHQPNSITGLTTMPVPMAGPWWHLSPDCCSSVWGRPDSCQNLHHCTCQQLRPWVIFGKGPKYTQTSF